jgi:hypothetical protein
VAPTGPVPIVRYDTKAGERSLDVMGQRPIAVHALENLGTTDTGITMLRHLLREQLNRVENRPRSY